MSTSILYLTVLFCIYIIAYSYNKQLLFQCNKVSKEYNAGHLLDKEARKWATKIAKENKMISDLQKQLKAIGTEDKVSVKLQTTFIFIFNDYKTIYTNNSRWHRCACLCALHVAGNQSTWRKPTWPTWEPHKYHTCWVTWLRGGVHFTSLTASCESSGCIVA